MTETNGSYAWAIGLMIAGVIAALVSVGLSA